MTVFEGEASSLKRMTLGRWKPARTGGKTRPVFQDLCLPGPLLLSQTLPFTSHFLQGFMQLFFLVKVQQCFIMAKNSPFYIQLVMCSDPNPKLPCKNLDGSILWGCYIICFRMVSSSKYGVSIWLGHMLV